MLALLNVKAIFYGPQNYIGVCLTVEILTTHVMYIHCLKSYCLCNIETVMLLSQNHFIFEKSQTSQSKTKWGIWGH